MNTDTLDIIEGAICGVALLILAYRWLIQKAKELTNPQADIRKRFPRARLCKDDWSGFFYIVVPELTDAYDYHRHYGTSRYPVVAWENTYQELKQRGEWK